MSSSGNLANATRSLAGQFKHSLPKVRGAGGQFAGRQRRVHVPGLTDTAEESGSDGRHARRMAALI